MNGRSWWRAQSLGVARFGVTFQGHSDNAEDRDEDTDELEVPHGQRRSQQEHECELAADFELAPNERSGRAWDWDLNGTPQ